MYLSLKENWKSGLTVALVSIPLSVSLAMSSGAPPAAGIITAVVAGIIGAAFGSSRYNIIGPTGALSGVTAAFALTQGAGLLPLMTVLAGLIIVFAYFIKVERYLVYVPSSVIHGFTLAISIILISSQLNYILGLHGLPVKASVADGLWQAFVNYDIINFKTVIYFSVFYLILLLIRKLNISIPGAIILSVMAIVYGYLCKSGILPIDVFTLGDKFPQIGLSFNFQYELEINRYIIGTALTVAFIAILETMLSAKIADKATNTSHNQRKEIMGLGMANLASGIFGGIPATGALARVSLNIRSGAKSKSSAIMNGVFVGIISFLLLSQFTYMPMAAIAAILVDTAVNMIEAKHFRKYRKYDKLSYIVAFIVCAVTIIEDPIFGIAAGVIISFFFFIDNISRGHFELSINDDNGLIRTMSGNKLRPIKEDGTVLLYTIRGTFVYINCEAHLARLESEYFEKFRTVIFRLREVYMIDLDGMETLDKMIQILRDKGITVLISSASDSMKAKLRRLSKEFIFMENHGQVFDKTVFALEYLGIKRNS